jgi:hypothetical protein
MSLGQNSIPQGIIQKVDISKGNNNLIRQDVTQNIVVYVVSAPDLDLPDTTVTSAFIQTDGDTGKNNKYNNRFQDIDQTRGDFPLFPTHFTVGDGEDIDTNNLVLDYGQFTNNDNVLDAIQFAGQQSVVRGTNNYLTNYSEQIIYDISWHEKLEFNLDDDYEDGRTFDDFLEDLSEDYIVDSVQFALQDISIFGNKNTVLQELDQTIATFVVLDDNFVEELQEDYSNLSPTQLATQDNFIDKKNNRIEQNITQNIKFDFSLSDDLNQNVSDIAGKKLPIEDLTFDLDDFILPVLENTTEDAGVFAPQKSRQVSDILGDANTDIKENSQTLVLSEKGKIVFPSFDDDIVKWGSNNNSNGLHNLIFAGARNNSSGNGGLIKGSKGDDLIVGGKGDKSIRGGKGNDIIIGCEDSDPTVDVNNNILTGGAGKDQFVLSMDCSNFITDFASDYDRILIQGSGDVTYDRVSGQLSVGGVQIVQLKPGTELDINKDIELIN